MDKKMTQLGKMFTYIALRRIRYVANSKRENALGTQATCYDDMTDSAKALVDELLKLGVVKLLHRNNKHFVSAYGEGIKLEDRYLRACADELRSGHFGKMKWDKRSKFHKELMAHIA